MGVKILYVYASVCIKERMCLYWVALLTEGRQCGVAPISKLRADLNIIDMKDSWIASADENCGKKQ
jgi:hypothetical protein